MQIKNYELFFFWNSDTFAFILPLCDQWIQIWGVCLFITRLKLNWQTGCQTIGPVHRWGGERRSYLLQRVYSSLLVTPRGGGRNCQPSWTSVDEQEKKKKKKHQKTHEIHLWSAEFPHGQLLKADKTMHGGSYFGKTKSWWDEFEKEKKKKKCTHLPPGHLCILEPFPYL